MLIYARVNSAFSGFAGLKLHLFIQPPTNKMGMANLILAIPLQYGLRNINELRVLHS